MESLEKTQTVGGIFLQSYLTLAQLDPLPFHVFTIFFYSLFLLANISLVPLPVPFLGFSVCLFLLHTCTCTHMCTYLGHGETIRSYARFWEFRGRIQVSLLIKEVSWWEKGSGQWTEHCFEFPKGCAWRRTGVSEQGSQCSWEPGDKRQLLRSVTFDLIFERKTSVIRWKTWEPVLLRSFSTRACFLQG